MNVTAVTGMAGGVEPKAMPGVRSGHTPDPLEIKPQKVISGTEGANPESEVSEKEADRRMQKAVEQANEKVKHAGNRMLEFSYNETTKRISIKVYDALTKEIIREIPPEKTLEMLERVYDLAGIMVDEKR